MNNPKQEAEKDEEILTVIYTDEDNLKPLL